MTTTARSPMLVPVVVSTAFFLENFDGTVVTTALPQMAVTFNSTPAAASIGVSAYMLLVAIFIPVSGWLADRFGTRVVFRAAIAVFTIASVLCGFSETLTQFTLARILQGIGGAMMIPVGRLIVLRSVEKKQFVRAMSFVTVPSVLGQVLGPPVGGFITTYFSWKWIFFLNIPIGIIGIVAVSALIANFRQAECPPLDWTGFLLTGASIGCLIYGLNLVVEPLADRAATLFFLAAGTVIGAVAVWHARRHPNAIIDLSLLKDRTFYSVLVGGFGFRLTVGAVGFLLPLQMQLGFGMTAFASGLLTMFVAVGTFMMKTAGPPILRRFGFRNVMLANGALGAISVLAFAFFTPSTSLWLISGVLFCSGLFRSLHFTSINTAAYADIPSAKMGSASSLANTADRFAIATGISVGAVLLQFGSAPGTAATPAHFQAVFLGVAALAMMSILPFLRLRRDAGSELSGHVQNGDRRPD
jgi:EmrB/QacA subfamily drug resistance transporter